MNNKTIKLTFYMIPFLFFLGLCRFSYADLVGKDLLENCEAKVKIDESKSNALINPSDAFQAGACTGYIKGFDDLEIIYASILAGPKAQEKDVKKYSLYCLTTGTTNVQLAKAIINYLKNHPTELNENASIVVAKAFRASFPCPK